MGKLSRTFEKLSSAQVMGRMLLDAVRQERCDLEDVLRLLREGASLRETDAQRGWNALQWVARHGHHQLIARAILLSDDDNAPAIDEGRRQHSITLALIHNHEAVAQDIANYMIVRRYKINAAPPKPAVN